MYMWSTINSSLKSECQFLLVDYSLQPSDGTCPCKSGYDDYGRGTEDCVPHIYPHCSEGTYRSQDGGCLSTSEWESYCSAEVSCLYLVMVTYIINNLLYVQ